MNVVFLDIDGPMIPGRAWAYNKAMGGDLVMKFFDPTSVALLNILTLETNSVVVVHSSWCYTVFAPCDDVLVHCAEQGIERIHSTVEYHENNYNYTGPAQTRWDAIRSYLARHPEVKNFCILDDESTDDVGLKDHLVHMTYMDGFLTEHFEKANVIMGNTEKKLIL